MNNLRNRLLTLQSSHVSATDSVGPAEYNNLIDQIKVLSSEHWPETPDDIDALYGEDKVSALAERLGLETRTTVRGFREYRENGDKKVPDQLKPLFLAIPLCTAECERGFSQMNLILSTVRNSLSVSTVSSLLFVKLF